MKTFKALVVALAMGAAALAQAAGTYDLGQITLGEEYTIPESYNYGTVQGTVAITESGVLTITGLNGEVVLYTDAAHTNLIESVWNGTYGPSYARDYAVTAGNTYYAYGDFVNVSPGMDKIRFEMASDIQAQLNYLIPAPGASLSPITNDTGEIVISFSAAVTYADATLSTGSTSVSLGASPSQAAAMQYVQVGETIRAWHASGILDPKGGDALTLTLTGVQTASGNLYNGDGKLTANYVSSAKLAELVSATVPADLKSFYPAGDPQALASFTFDKPLLDDGATVLSLGMGNVESENAYYYENIPATISGNTATVDLSGKLRDLNSYAAAQGSNFVEARLVNVRDLDGNRATGGGAGLVGSYVWNLNYVYIEPADIASEFIPATGASLQGVNSIEIWFNHADLLTFDGVLFSCPDIEVVVPLSELTIGDDAGGKVINVNIPAQIKGKQGVTVTLNNLVSLDGYDHTSQIMAQYDQFVVTLVAPIAPGQPIASTGDADFVITANGDYQYLRYDFYNKAATDEDSGWAYGTEFVKQANGTWTAYNGDYICYNNYAPRMVVSAWLTEEDYQMARAPEATYEFTFVGTTLPFEYSSIKFVGIDPLPDTTINAPFDDFHFTVTFDGMVTVTASISLGMGMSCDFDQVVGVDPEGAYANTWLLYPGKSFMESNPGIDIAIFAYDMDGRLVEGNLGGEQYDYLSFSYLINSGQVRELTIEPESGATVEELTYFIVSYPGMGVGPDLNFSGDMPMVYDRFQNCIYTFTADNINVIDDLEGGENTRVLLTVDPAITDPGMYLLYIPQGFFLVGSQFDTLPSAECWSSVVIEGIAPPADGITLVVNPAEGNVDALTRIDITAVEENIENAGMPNFECTADITIADASGNVIYTKSVFEMDQTYFDWDTWTYNGFYVEPNITANGTYTLDIPAGFITFYYGESYSAPLVAVYTIGAQGGITSLVVDKADRYDVYTLAGVRVISTANAADLSTLRPGVYIINGKKVMVK